MVPGKKALLVIAPSQFRDEELVDTQGQLELAGVNVTIASNHSGVITGTGGGTANAQTTIQEVDIEEYDALVFIGGPGAQNYYEDEHALALAENAFQKEKIVGAICIAPGILAHAGVLEGKKATIWDSGSGEHSSVLEEGGAEYTGDPVTVDGKIVTASGPASAKAFGQKLAEMLAQE